jgi:predicted DNA-binding transcriptional regulator YafY
MVAPELLSRLSLYLGETVNYLVVENKPADKLGWREVTIYYENFFKARECVLNFGRAAEVLEPEALHWSVIDHARQIIDFYKEKSVAR